MLAYFLPLILYIGAPYLVEGFLKDPVVGYASRVLLTLPVLIFYLKEYREIKIQKDLLGIPVGVLIILLWIGLDPYYPKILGEPTGLDPSTYFLPTIALKFIGMVILAPWIEELFFRSFLPRFLDKGNDWKEAEVGSFTPFSFISTALIFGFIHFQWIPGIIF